MDWQSVSGNGLAKYLQGWWRRVDTGEGVGRVGQVPARLTKEVRTGVMLVRWGGVGIPADKWRTVINVFWGCGNVTEWRDQEAHCDRYTVNLLVSWNITMVAYGPFTTVFWFPQKINNKGNISLANYLSELGLLYPPPPPKKSRMKNMWRPWPFLSFRQM